MALFKAKKEDSPEIIEEEINLIDQEVLTKKKIEEEDKAFEMYHRQKNTPAAELSVLQADVTVEGNINCLSNLSVFGEVRGDVSCQLDLKIESYVKGEVKGGNIDLKGAKIDGNVICEHDLRVDNKTVINGDVSAENCTIDGKVTGNVTVVGALHIQKNAVVNGDMSAETISVLQGAKIRGAVTMEKEVKNEEE